MRYKVKANESLFNDWKRLETQLEHLKLKTTFIRGLVQNDTDLDESMVKESREIAFLCYKELDMLKEKLKRLTKFTLDYARADKIVD